MARHVMEMAGHVMEVADHVTARVLVMQQPSTCPSAQ